MTDDAEFAAIEFFAPWCLTARTSARRGRPSPRTSTRASRATGDSPVPRVTVFSVDCVAERTCATRSTSAAIHGALRDARAVQSGDRRKTPAAAKEDRRAPPRASWTPSGRKRAGRTRCARTGRGGARDGGGDEGAAAKKGKRREALRQKRDRESLRAPTSWTSPSRRSRRLARLMSPLCCDERARESGGRGSWICSPPRTPEGLRGWRARAERRARARAEARARREPMAGVRAPLCRARLRRPRADASVRKRRRRFRESRPGRLKRTRDRDPNPGTTRSFARTRGARARARRGERADTRAGSGALLHTSGARAATEGGAAWFEKRAGWIEHFFPCDDCRARFLAMAAEVPRGEIVTARDAQLWLWRAHNEVNARGWRRARRGARAPARATPLFPKAQWPAYAACEACREVAAGANEAVRWDEEAVAAFLTVYFHGVGAPRLELGTGSPALGAPRGDEERFAREKLSLCGKKNQPPRRSAACFARLRRARGVRREDEPAELRERAPSAAADPRRQSSPGRISTSSDAAADRLRQSLASERPPSTIGKVRGRR